MENNGSVVDFELSSNSGHNVMAIMKFVAYDQVFRLFHCQCVCVCVVSGWTGSSTWFRKETDGSMLQISTDVHLGICISGSKQPD